MSLDVTFVPEFAEAGFLRPFSDDEAADLTRGVLDAPRKTVEWNDQVVAAPFWANTQLLWYRKSVAQEAGLDLSQPVTWDQVIDAARTTHTTVEVEADLYEGYMVWINALVASGGGEVLKDSAAGRDATPELASRAGRTAAEIIHRVATSGVADPQINTAIEETARTGFQAGNEGSMVNWPYIYAPAKSAVQDGLLDLGSLRVLPGDGASRPGGRRNAWQAFRKVIVPLAAPGVFTAAILTFFFAWNDFVLGISLSATSDSRPVPAALAFFTGESFFEQPTAAISAAAVIVTIPVIVLVLIFQRRIVSGLTSGAVKG